MPLIARFTVCSLAVAGLLTNHGQADEPYVLRGVVVDEASRPVAGVAVRPLRWDDATTQPAVTGADGAFELSLPRAQTRFLPLVASTADGSRLGYVQYNPRGEDAATPVEPPRIVLKPARIVSVSVRDAAGKPVAGADVEVGTDYRAAGGGRTGEDGRLIVNVPADAPLQYVIALCGGLGFDYVQRAPDREAADFSLPDPVELTLDGVSTVRVKAVDNDGKPVSGVEFAPWYIQKLGREYDVNTGGSRVVRAVTDQQGVAVFDWFPAEFERGIPILFRSSGWHCSEQINYRPDALETTFRATLRRYGRVSGRVLDADGKPAEGILVQIDGEGPGSRDTFRTSVVTDGEGRYAADVAPRHAYILSVVDNEWAARSLMDVAIDESQEREGLDLTLLKGTRIHGVLTNKSKERLGGQRVGIRQQGMQIPFDAEDGSNYYKVPSYMRWVQTNDQGEFEFRVGPGEYTLLAPDGRHLSPVTIADQEQYQADLQFEDVNRMLVPLAGRATRADDGRPVEGVIVTGVAIDPDRGRDPESRTDVDGRFRVERIPSRMLIHATTENRTLGATVEISAETSELELRLRPTAGATGQIVDERGRSTPGFRFDCGIEIAYPGGSFTNRFTREVVTDDDGRFTLDGLIIGQSYKLYHAHRNSWIPIADVTAATEQAVDVGVRIYARERRDCTHVEWLRDTFAQHEEEPATILDAVVAEARWDHRRTLAVVSSSQAPLVRVLFDMFSQMRIDADDPWQRRVQRNVVDDFVLAGLRPDGLGTLRSRGGDALPESGDGFPLLVALDEEGRVLGHLAAPQFRSQDAEAAIDGRAVVSFLKKYAPPPPDADSLLAAALEQATDEKKVVLLLQVSAHDEQSQKLARRLARHWELLAPWFVPLTIDAGRMFRGQELVKAVREHIGERFPGRDEDAVPWVGAITAEGEPVPAADDQPGVARPLASPAQVDRLIDLLRQSAPGADEERLLKLRAALIEDRT